MAKFNSFSALAEHITRTEECERAAKEREAQIKAQMDAMWEARERKAAADRKAQMSAAWYLYR